MTSKPRSPAMTSRTKASDRSSVPSLTRGVRLSRRETLKGIGVSLGMPLLEAMQPRSLLAAPQSKWSPPVRGAFVFFPNGAIMPAWRPAQESESGPLPDTLLPLEPMRSDFNIITGLAQDNGRAKGDGAGDHARCAASFLTGAHPVKTSGAGIRVGVSVDQVAAEQIGRQTRLASLELGIEPGRNSGDCDSGYSCAYSSNISWKTPTTPMTKEIVPRLVFERMFGSNDDVEGRQRRAAYRQSVLDLVAEDASRLRRQLGTPDRHKLDEYFSSVRTVERSIEKAEQLGPQHRPEMQLPPGVPEVRQQHIRLMFDLMVLAFQTDTTRVATFMLGNAGSNCPYSMVGVNDGHHHLSHHQNDPEKIKKIQRIDRFLIEQFAYFLDRLKSVREGDATLLDHAVVLYGSGISDGNRHLHHDLPVLLAGRGGGSIRSGRHIHLAHETPMNNLFLSMLDMMNAKVEKIGDSSGRLGALS